MPSPESNRRNLEHARMLGRVIFWRTRSESQRVKAEIVLLHHTKPGLSQRVIARAFHVSQPYVAKMLRRVLTLGIEKVLGAEAYEQYRKGLDTKRREHFLAVSGPASLTVEPSYSESTWGFAEQQPAEPISYVAPAAVMEKVDEPAGTEYVELARSTSGEIIEMHGSKPACALTDSQLQQFRNARWIPPASSWVSQFTAKEIAQLFVADQCPSFGRR